MGSLTQAIWFITEKSEKLQGINEKLTHISISNSLRQSRKDYLKARRSKK